MSPVFPVNNYTSSNNDASTSGGVQTRTLLLNMDLGTISHVMPAAVRTTQEPIAETEEPIPMDTEEPVYFSEDEVCSNITKFFCVNCKYDVVIR